MRGSKGYAAASNAEYACRESKEKTAKAAASFLSSAIYLAAIGMAVAIAVYAVTPAISGMQDAAAAIQARSALSDIDANIQKIASGGVGSSAIVSFGIKRGRIAADAGNNRITYSLETSSKYPIRASYFSKSRAFGGFEYAYSDSAAAGLSALSISKNYSDSSISIAGDFLFYPGSHSVLIKNSGSAESNGKIVIDMREV